MIRKELKMLVNPIKRGVGTLIGGSILLMLPEILLKMKWI